MLVPLKLTTVLSDMMNAPPKDAMHDAPLPRKVVFPVNVRLLLTAMIPPPMALL